MIQVTFVSAKLDYICTLRWFDNLTTKYVYCSNGTRSIRTLSPLKNEAWSTRDDGRVRFILHNVPTGCSHKKCTLFAITNSLVKRHVYYSLCSLGMFLCESIKLNTGKYNFPEICDPIVFPHPVHQGLWTTLSSLHEYYYSTTYCFLFILGWNVKCVVHTHKKIFLKWKGRKRKKQWKRVQWISSLEHAAS